MQLVSTSCRAERNTTRCSPTRATCGGLDSERRPGPGANRRPLIEPPSSMVLSDLPPAYLRSRSDAALQKLLPLLQRLVEVKQPQPTRYCLTRRRFASTLKLTGTSHLTPREARKRRAAQQPIVFQWPFEPDRTQAQRKQLAATQTWSTREVPSVAVPIVVVTFPSA